MRNWQRTAAGDLPGLDVPPSRKNRPGEKEMRLFRPLVGDDNDAPALLEAALALASHRVVVKRPRKAPCIAGPKPSHALDGKSSRYDIYPKKRETLKALTLALSRRERGLKGKSKSA